MVSTRRSSSNSANKDDNSSTNTPKRAASKTLTPRRRPKKKADGDDGGSSVNSGSTASSRGVPHHIQKQLLEDIESKFGLKQFAKKMKGKELQKLLDLNENLYGKLGSDLRRKISNKYDKWKANSDEDYLKVCLRFKITPHKCRAESESKSKSNSKRKSESEGNTISDISSGSEPDALSDEESPKKKLPTTLGKLRVKSPRPSTTKAHKIPSTIPEEEDVDEKKPSTVSIPRQQPQTSGQRSSEPKSTQTKKKMSGTPRDQIPINVVPGTPGDQGEGVHCMKLLPSVEHGGLHYEGCCIKIQANSRDYAKGHYWIEYEEGKDEMVLHKPRFEQPYIEDKAEHDARQTEVTVQKAHDNARSTYSKMGLEEKTKKFTLKMPSGWQLTQKPFGVAVATVGTATARVEQVVYKHTTNHRDAQQNVIYEIVFRLLWRFANEAGTDDTNVAAKGGNAAVAAAYGELEAHSLERLGALRIGESEPMDPANETAAPVVSAPVVSASLVATTTQPSTTPSGETSNSAQPAIRPPATTPTGKTSNSVQPILLEPNKKRKAVPHRTPSTSFSNTGKAALSNPYQHLPPAESGSSNSLGSTSLDIILASNDEQRVAALRKKLLIRKKSLEKDRRGSFKPTTQSKHEERHKEMQSRGVNKREEMLAEKRNIRQQQEQQQPLVVDNKESNKLNPREDIDEAPKE